MDRKQVSVGESYLNVVDVGQGPVILFVHGFPLDHTVWKHQIEEFSKSNRVVCPDLRGYGQSPRTTSDVSMRGLGLNLATLLDGLKINQPVCYCGLSMGGYIGWEFWKQFPDRLSQIVACDTRAAADSEAVKRARIMSAKLVSINGTEKLAKEMVQKLFWKPNLSKGFASTIEDTIRNTHPASVSDGQLAMAARSDATTWLPEIKVPTLFVVGEFDEITTPEEMRGNAELVPDSTFVQVTKAGHLSPLENPVEFNDALRSFLQSASP